MALTEGEGALEVPRLTVGGDGWVQYKNPTVWDRYLGINVLLARPVGAPSGRPDGARLSPFRQFHCMERLLCQGCGRPAARNPETRAVLWVQALHRGNGKPTRSTGPTDMPPSCARCALRWCPVLAERGRRLVWARKADRYGVYADLYPPPRGNPVVEQLVRLGDQRRLSCAVATRLLRNIQKITVADRNMIEALAAQQQPPHAQPGPTDHRSTMGPPVSGDGSPTPDGHGCPGGFRER